MTANAMQLVFACFVMVLLTFVVSMKRYRNRIREMRQKRIDPQTISTFAQITTRLEDTLAADNFRNLYETPVLFYALVARARYQSYSRMAGVGLLAVCRIAGTA